MLKMIMSLWRMMMPYKDPVVRKEYFKKYNKKYRQENRDSIREYERKYYHTFIKENPWIEMIKRAKRRKILPFNITNEYVKSIWPEDNKCPALGIEFKRGTKGSPVDSSPSLDRINNSKGYTKGNVQIVCQLANKIMTNATPEQVMAVAKHYKKITEKKNAA